LNVKAHSSASIDHRCLLRSHPDSRSVAARAKHRLPWATVPKNTEKDRKREVIHSQFPLGRNWRRTLLDHLTSLDLVARRLPPGLTNVAVIRKE
jgi:hypothetical protein